MGVGEQAAGRTEANLVVVPGEKAQPLGRGHVAPVARAGPDERLGVGRSELERGGRIAGVGGALGEAFACAADGEAEADAGLVEEVLRLGKIGTRQVFDARESEIPALVQGGFLGEAPHRIKRASMRIST